MARVPGSGCRFLEQYPAAVTSRIDIVDAELLPAAQDLVPLAQVALQEGEVQSAHEVQPVYVRDEITWKKLSEQGKRS